jgi:hypothetical protein
MFSPAEKVQRWRKHTKERIVKSMGSKCVCCGYNKCHAALHLHHLDPNEKEFSFGKIKANPKSWGKIIKELRKCVLVCGNCHAEIHYGERKIPKNAKKFNELFVTYKEKKKPETDKCPVCGNMKIKKQKTCSRLCATRKSRKVKWEEVDLKALIEQYSFVKIGKILGVTDNAVRKRARKLKLID